MQRKLRVSPFYLTPLSLLQNVWFNTTNQFGAIVSGVRTEMTNKEFSDFNNIPMSIVKKHKRDYNDFSTGVIVLKLMTSGRFTNIAVTLTIMILLQG